MGRNVTDMQESATQIEKQKQRCAGEKYKECLGESECLCVVRV